MVRLEGSSPMPRQSGASPPTTEGGEPKCLAVSVFADVVPASDIVEAVDNKVVLACGVFGCHAACRVVTSESGAVSIEGVNTLGQIWTLKNCIRTNEQKVIFE